MEEIMKILVAVDGSEFTNKAMRYVASHVQLLKDTPELHLLNVHRPLPSALAVKNARRLLGDSAVDDYYKEEAEAALAPAEKALNAEGIPFRSSYRVGDVEKEIHAYVRENGIAMIVMGSHGHGTFTSAVLGSVATKILAHTDVPVLIVR
jgi:nucleotide-binding universal stress UspA family protein